ncbi:hypothetical protein Bca4012_075234 [Brassica carinata]
MNGPWNYALVCGWNDVVKANGLKDVDNISLWSFRCRGVLDEVLKLAECEIYIILKWGLPMELFRHGGEMEVLQRSGT